MSAGNFQQTRRSALAMPLVLLLLLTPPLIRAQSPVQTSQGVAAAGVVATNQAAKQVSAPRSSPPVPAATKRKAGFLAGAGLAILSLLALAAGLALVRTFKR